ncbi:hypothetical protein yc1106_09235 [Curvularia clavata]|uniref:DUF4211 domain-containing protein n=1 Tax=Curvularia clavata TaxID=95742 RepID=A0A9Q8ZH46_CURCL|nr:hypothetical protein yc1106_09235 [Curvularia clavata]
MARKKVRDRKRQTKINFSPASQSTQATASSNAASTADLPTRPPRKQQKLTDIMSGTTRKQKHQESTSEDELVVVKKSGMFRGPRNDASDSESTDEVEERAQIRIEPEPEPESRKRRRKELSSEPEDTRPTVTVLPRKRQRRTVEIEIGSSDEGHKKKEKKKGKKEKKQSKRRKEKESTPEPAPRSTRREVTPTPDNDEEEDELPRPAQSSKRKTMQRRSPSAEEQEEAQSPPRSARRKLKRRRLASEDEDEVQIKPEPREHGAGAISASDAEPDDAENNEEQEELREELAYLRSSPVADRGLGSTYKTNKNKRQEALEALKRRRAGTTEQPSSSATPGRRRAVVVDTDSDSELEVIKEEPNDDLGASGQDDSDEEPESDREANALDMFQEDQDDDQFIDDDEENVIGEPSANADLDEMRLAFSLSRAKTKELFRHAVEWMVMKKIHPGFESTKYIYTATFRKLDDEVKALAGSKYTSSAWTADFTRAICARPDIMINDLSAAERAVMSPHCEACNRTNHTASSEILFQGQPYDPETLEPLASDSDSDSDSDSSGLSSDSEAMLNGEKPTYNRRGERIPPESHAFPVGSTCRANAQVAHTLYHWRYHLYQWVKDYLKAEGHLTAEKLVKRDGWSDRKRDKAARKIVSAMEAKGQIRELYHSYKNQVTAAVEADNDYRNGWGRNRG